MNKILIPVFILTSILFAGCAAGTAVPPLASETAVPRQTAAPTQSAPLSVTPTLTATPRPTNTPEPTATSVPIDTLSPSATPQPMIPFRSLGIVVERNNIGFYARQGTVVPLDDFTGGACLQVQISEDGSLVAFARDGSLHIIQTDGRNARTLVTAAAVQALYKDQLDQQPEIASWAWIGGDHTLLVTTRLRLPKDPDQNRSFFLKADADGGNAEQIASLESASLPFLSPDGRWFAVESAAGVHLVDSQSGTMRLVDPFVAPLAAERLSIFLPFWAIDSSAIVYAVTAQWSGDKALPPFDYRRASVASGELSHFLSLEAGPREAVFSPDLEHVAYLVWQKQKGVWDLTVSDALGKEITVALSDINLKVIGWIDQQTFLFTQLEGGRNKYYINKLDSPAGLPAFSPPVIRYGLGISLFTWSSKNILAIQGDGPDFQAILVEQSEELLKGLRTDDALCRFTVFPVRQP